MGYEDCDKSTRGVESERVYVKVIKFVRLWEFFDPEVFIALLSYVRTPVGRT